ncbi:MAG: hypothetical protein J5709_10850 [Bacteroidales bacterium]|nr:hypothetical protein [Bacteroidales bacterium]
MKASVISAILVFGILAGCFSSCKDSPRQYIGEYTYQSDGTITIGMLVEDIDVPVTDKMGQMQIMKGDEKGKVTILKSSITGEIKRLSGEVSDGELKIDEYTYEKEIELDTIINGKAKITYTAKGNLRDNTIVLDDNYSGFFTEKESGAVGTIRSNNAITIAKLND